MNESIDRRSAGAVTEQDVRTRALALWPGLDRKKMTRTRGDPHHLARLIEHRTALPREAILGLLGAAPPAKS